MSHAFILRPRWFVALLSLFALAAANAHAVDLLVGSYSSAKVLRYDGTTGAFLNVFADVNGPQGMAIGPDGNIYLAHDQDHFVSQHNPTTGTTIDPAFFNTDTGTTGVVFRPNGIAYVGIPGGLRRFNATTGAFIDTLISASGIGAFDFGPDGNIYAVNRPLGVVQRYNVSTGAFIDTFATLPGSGVNGSGLIFAPNGSLLVANTSTGAIQQYNGTTGTPLGEFVAAGNMVNPLALAFGPDANLYISDHNGTSSVVKRFNGATGAYIDTFIPALSGGLNSATSLLFYPAPVAPATPVTVNDWELTASADAGDSHLVSSPVLIQDTAVDLPFKETRTATDDPSTGETKYDFSVGLNTALFQIDFDHVRGGIDNYGIAGSGDSNAASYGTIDFTAADTLPYSITGRYALTGSKLIRFRGKLVDTTTAQVLFENWQSSGHTSDEIFVVGETGGDQPFGPNYPAYFDVLTGSQNGTLIAGHTYQFTYEASIQTTVADSFPSPNIAEASATGFFSLAIGGIPFVDAGPTDPAFIDGTRAGNGGIPAPPETITLLSLDLLDGSSFTLDPHETLVLTGGPLYIGPGAVFTGNGIVQGGIINAGLLRIPIVRIQTVSQTSGGFVEIELPAPAMPGAPIMMSGDFGVAEDTLVSFAGVSGGAEPSPIVLEGTPQPNDGIIRWDASLEVTGSFEQRATGALRMFIGGHDMPGVNYSQLTVGEGVTLAGAIELVLQPELFIEFGYMPVVGDTFDLIVAPQGITIADTGLLLRSFSTQDGAPLIVNLTFSPYDSGIAADPDHLLQIGESIFRIDLVENNTILRATLLQPISAVPEPALAYLALIGAGLIAATHRHTLSEKHRS